MISRFYNQASVLHTICRIFAAPAMNQVVAMAPLMDDCFQQRPDLAPYVCLPENVALDELNPRPSQAKSKVQAALGPLTEKLDFSQPDQLGGKADLFSRFVWLTVRGDEPFPAAYAGAHGKGLKALGLQAEAEDRDDR